MKIYMQWKDRELWVRLRNKKKYRKTAQGSGDYLLPPPNLQTNDSKDDSRSWEKIWGKDW